MSGMKTASSQRPAMPGRRNKLMPDRKTEIRLAPQPREILLKTQQIVNGPKIEEANVSCWSKGYGYLKWYASLST